jgi:hypothetical protein
VDYKPTQASVEFDRIERDMRTRLASTLDMTARFDEEIVDSLGLGERDGGRRLRDAVERELACS